MLRRLEPTKVRVELNISPWSHKALVILQVRTRLSRHLINLVR